MSTDHITVLQARSRWFDAGEMTLYHLVWPGGGCKGIALALDTRTHAAL